MNSLNAIESDHRRTVLRTPPKHLVCSPWVLLGLTAVLAPFWVATFFFVPFFGQLLVLGIGVLYFSLLFLQRSAWMWLAAIGGIVVSILGVSGLDLLLVGRRDGVLYWLIGAGTIFTLVTLLLLGLGILKLLDEKGEAVEGTATVL